MRSSSIQPKPHRRSKRRRDAGKQRLTLRDVFALTWIAHQYAIRLDHLQWVLGRYPGYGAKHTNWISEGAARDVVNRWEQMGYIRAEGIRDKQPFWIWITRKGLNKLGLAYTYSDLEESGLDAFTHLYAINAIRLDIESDYPDVQWTSERTLRREQVRIQEKAFLHRPDAVVVFEDGETVAIEAELSAKKPWELDENLLELLRGEEYLKCKIDLGAQLARTLSTWARSPYEKIWYYAPKAIRKQVRARRSKLVADGVIREEDAERIAVFWYPLALTETAIDQQDQEEDEAFGFEREDEDRPESEDAGLDR
jgi:hypothetical protein